MYKECLDPSENAKLSAWDRASLMPAPSSSDLDLRCDTDGVTMAYEMYGNRSDRFGWILVVDDEGIQQAINCQTFFRSTQAGKVANELHMALFQEPYLPFRHR